MWGVGEYSTWWTLSLTLSHILTGSGVATLLEVGLLLVGDLLFGFLGEYRFPTHIVYKMLIIIIMLVMGATIQSRTLTNQDIVVAIDCGSNEQLLSLNNYIYEGVVPLFTFFYDRTATTPPTPFRMITAISTTTTTLLIGKSCTPRTPTCTGPSAKDRGVSTTTYPWRSGVPTPSCWSMPR